MIGTAILLLCGLFYAAYTFKDELTEQFAPQASQKVHVHAGFLFTVMGHKVDLTASKYQSSTESVKHKYMHLHDNIDSMLHRHAEGITLGEFMRSIGITLQKDCVALDSGEEYCTNTENALRLYVNGNVEEDPDAYVIQEEDRLLLYYGDPASSDIPTFINEVSDEACMYSGTCPERGEPPAESCGITCEI